MYLVHFLHHQFRRRAERYVQHYFLGIEDIIVVEQRRMQGIVDCFCHTIFSFAESGTHDCYSTIFQDGFHIGKVKIDWTGICKSVTGEAAKKIIDDFAILEIKVLLQSTGLTIQEIADRLGFPDQSYLGRYFKRHEGMSPKEYQSKYSI